MTQPNNIIQMDKNMFLQELREIQKKLMALEIVVNKMLEKIISECCNYPCITDSGFCGYLETTEKRKYFCTKYKVVING